MSPLGTQRYLGISSTCVRVSLDCVAKLPLRRLANDDSIELRRASAGAAHDGSAGRQTRPVFYSFNLDQVVPTDHLVRQIDDVLDLAWVNKELAPYYSHTGRPSIDPVLMMRMLIVG
jgi:hypothetical protein